MFFTVGGSRHTDDLPRWPNKKKQQTYYSTILIKLVFGVNLTKRDLKYREMLLNPLQPKTTDITLLPVQNKQQYLTGG